MRPFVFEDYHLITVSFSNCDRERENVEMKMCFEFENTKMFEIEKKKSWHES